MQFEGVISEPLNPLALAIAAGATFVARSFSGDKEHLKNMIKAAVNHKGYALIDIMQPCVSFNKINTFKWYKDRVYYLDETYDASNKGEAIVKAMEFGDGGIPLGILYNEEGKPTFHDLHPVLSAGNIMVDRQWVPTDGEKFVKEFM
jgi:2-oxoglutarate ferredoxin oxidoreductase subunit beta